MNKDEFRYHTPQQAAVTHHPKGFFGNLGRSFQVYNWVGQLATHGRPTGWLYDPVAGYRVTEDPQFKGDLDQMRAAIQAGSESPAESAELIRRYQVNRQIKQAIEIDNSWVAPVAAGVLDPINLIPIPSLLGAGVVRGAIRGGVGIGATGALSEGLRAHLDPTMTPGELAINMGAATVIGTGLGATLGRFTRKPRWARGIIERSGRAYDNAIQGGKELVDETPLRPEAFDDQIARQTREAAERVAKGEETQLGRYERMARSGEISVEGRATPQPSETRVSEVRTNVRSEFSEPGGNDGVDSVRLPDRTVAIKVNDEQLEASWRKKAWTENRELPENAFKSKEEWRNYLTLEERLRISMPFSAHGFNEARFNEAVVSKAYNRFKNRGGSGVVERPRGYTDKSNHLNKLRADAETMEVEQQTLKQEIADLKRRRAAGEKMVKWTEGKELTGDQIAGYQNSADKLADHFKVTREGPC